MRILLTFVTTGRGGDAIQLMALAEALREHGHEVTCIGAHPVDPYAFDTDGGRARETISRLPWWVRDLSELGLGLLAARRILRAGRARPVDLMIHRAGVYDFEAGSLARRLHAPLILYLDSHVEAERSFRGEAYWRRLHAWSMRTLGQAARVVTAPSRAIAEYFIGLGIPSDKFVICRNGVSQRHLRMGMEMVHTHPPLPGNRPVTIGFVGSLAGWHRVDLLLDAVRRLNASPRLDAGSPPSEHEPCRLVIVGRGREFNALKARARSLGVDGFIEWRGAMQHDAAVRAMADFDIAVLPGTLSTGTPMKLAEYAAMARPIVAPDLPNIRDMFAEGTEVVLVAPGDTDALARAIRGLAADPQRARSLGRAAQARMANYTWEATIEPLLSRVAEQGQVP
jgi:glycosyltransferase involved in cell wall biosynthesis